ncbi:MAG: hypothetical protein ACR2PU_02615, partial [Gammaproteobacteria bacterium]
MSEINETFDVLSDPIKKKQYSQRLASNEYYESEESTTSTRATEDFNRSLDSDWSTAVKYFPDLEEIINNLSKISKPLAQTYKVYIL